MGYFRGTIRSGALGMDTLANVILPYDPVADTERPPCTKTLYLLHGLKQNADAWPRFSSVERFASVHGYALVIPEVQRSFYTDMAMGMPYFTYLTEELPATVHAMFRLPEGPENTFAAGLSMGGYGAMKCALTRPDVFGGAICLSSAFFRLDEPEALSNFTRSELSGIIGAELKRGQADDLIGMLERFPTERPRPLLYLACGAEDFLYDHNQRMRDALTEHDFPHLYEEWPGVHDWVFWDKAIERGMAWLAGEHEARRL